MGPKLLRNGLAKHHAIVGSQDILDNRAAAFRTKIDDRLHVVSLKCFYFVSFSGKRNIKTASYLKDRENLTKIQQFIIPDHPR
jgi:hypothetical protein